MFADQLGDHGEVLDGFFAHLEADVFTQRQHLQADKLFAQIFAEALAHAAEELDCHDAVVFVVVVVGHFDDMFEDEVAPIFVIEFVGQEPQFAACFFFRLRYPSFTS